MPIRKNGLYKSTDHRKCIHLISKYSAHFLKNINSSDRTSANKDAEIFLLTGSSSPLPEAHIYLIPSLSPPDIDAATLICGTASYDTPIDISGTLGSKKSKIGCNVLASDIVHEPAGAISDHCHTKPIFW